jgi:hypothetical protein
MYMKDYIPPMYGTSVTLSELIIKVAFSLTVLGLVSRGYVLP